MNRPQDRSPRPPVRLIMSTPIHALAFGLGTGCSPRAPGTVGTVLGVPLFLALAWLPLPLYLAVSLILFVFGCWLCGESSRLLGVHDSPGIVFDEVVGYLIAAAPLLPTLSLTDRPLWQGLLLAFLLFRIFDVVKPWPIRWLDRQVHGGFGIMVDDLLAGVFAAAVLVAAILVVG